MELKISEILTTKLNENRPAIEKTKQDDFSFTLSRLNQDDLSIRLKNLIDDISEVGNNIARHMELKDMKKYRALINDFVHEVVTNSYSFSRENFLDKRGRHRVYGIVKMIDKNLAELAEELLAKEKDHIAILDKTDEIRGLLLDIIV